MRNLAYTFNNKCRKAILASYDLCMTFDLYWDRDRALVGLVEVAGWLRSQIASGQVRLEIKARFKRQLVNNLAS